MVNIKNQQLKAYILLESLIALGVLVTIVALVLNQINRNHEHLVKRLHEQEVFNGSDNGGAGQTVSFNP
ncbi:competence system putative prepilin ComGE [Streptococcus hillyeri]|uniref:competence system putative prepilin ComGE n=1 Tax=Streptococcus hillyeri TaxID=2282420 RepID=UPI003CCC4CCA